MYSIKYKAERQIPLRLFQGYISRCVVLFCEQHAFTSFHCNEFFIDSWKHVALEETKIISSCKQQPPIHPYKNTSMGLSKAIEMIVRMQFYKVYVWQIFSLVFNRDSIARKLENFMRKQAEPSPEPEVEVQKKTTSHGRM